MQKQVPTWVAVVIIVVVLLIVVGIYSLAGRRGAQPFEPSQPIHGKAKGAPIGVPGPSPAPEAK